jgi:hypothetical protein
MQGFEGPLRGLLWGLLLIGTPIALLRHLISRGKTHPAVVPIEDDSTLRAALGNMRCNLCKRGCELVAPRCGRGKQLRDKTLAGL